MFFDSFEHVLSGFEGVKVSFDLIFLSSEVAFGHEECFLHGDELESIMLFLMFLAADVAEGQIVAGFGGAEVFDLLFMDVAGAVTRSSRRVHRTHGYDKLFIYINKNIDKNTTFQ